MLGSIGFAGELLVRELISSQEHLLALAKGLLDPEPEKLEALAVLLRTVGPTFDDAQWPEHKHLKTVFERVAALSKDKNVPGRMKCLLRDVVDLRRDGWESSLAVQAASPSTLDEVAREVPSSLPRVPKTKPWLSDPWTTPSQQAAKFSIPTPPKAKKRLGGRDSPVSDEVSMQEIAMSWPPSQEVAMAWPCPVTEAFQAAQAEAFQAAAATPVTRTALKSSASKFTPGSQSTALKSSAASFAPGTSWSPPTVCAMPQWGCYGSNYNGYYDPYGSY
jgi:hypothetical protein